MKTIEEKAKAYDEAIKKAESLYKAAEPMSGCNVIIETLFPELKESEDERTRKELVSFLEICQDTRLVGNRDREKWIAWLEKQGEQIDIANKEYWRGYREGKKEILDKYTEIEKQNGQDILEDAVLDGNEDGLIAETIRFKNEKQSEQKSDKVKPKFKIGDFIANDYCFGKVIALTDDAYLLDTEQGVPFSCEHNVHLWTIQDAKDGDVLYINNTVSESIMIYKSFNNGIIKKYASYNEFVGFEGEHYLTLNDGYITPATKEQRDTLMKAMVDAGYTFDFEKKELKKIEPKPEENKGNICGISPNSAWSEEDDMILSVIVNDLKFIRDTLSHDDSYVVDVGSFEGKIEWLQSLKDRVQPQPKQEWSEEDEQHIDSLLKRLDSLCKNKFERTRFAISEDRDWLKSLRPQNRWKPSSEQIGLLQAIINEPNNAASESCQIVLREVLEQLKKLKEE